MPNQIDPRQIIKGFDGELYDQDTNEFLCHVNTFKGEVTFETTEYVPAGSSMKIPIPIAKSATLTLQETLITDALLKRVFAADASQQSPGFNFMGQVTRSDGSVGRYSFRGCVPNGAVALFDVAPGTILKRDWTFGVQQWPELQDTLG